MELHLIRNATVVLGYAGRRLLVDPSLDPARAWDVIEGIANPQRNPVAELPVPAEEVVAGVDGVLVSHLHVDHFDAAARALLPPTVPVLCQAEHRGALTGDGFVDVDGRDPGGTSASWLGIDVTLTRGHHSNGPSRELLAPVAGFVLTATGEPTTWIAGDTVWCAEAADALDRARPDVVVVNAGAARQLDGERITMDAGDVEQVLRAAPAATVVAVHLEALGHCTQGRAELRAALAGYGARLVVPEDGQRLALPDFTSVCATERRAPSPR